jgi:hypothetical protein
MERRGCVKLGKRNRMCIVASRVIAIYAVFSEDHMIWKGRKEVSFVFTIPFQSQFASETYSK